MKRRLLFGLAALLIVVIVSAAAGVYSLPPQFLPESIYQFKFGGMYPVSRSVGDGTLTDYGPRAGIDRYVIDLGEVGRESEFEKSFDLTELPRERFTLFIHIAGNERFGLLEADRPEIGTAGLELTRKTGELVIRERGALRKWIWSMHLSHRDQAFLYKSGERKTNAKTDNGRGTSFTPEPSESYKLVVSTKLTPEATQKYKFRLSMKGGGWMSPPP